MKFAHDDDVRVVYTDNWMNSNREAESWKRACGCIKTSDKLKQLLQSFPAPPPPTAVASAAVPKDGDASLPPGDHPVTCISAYCKHSPTFRVGVHVQPPVAGPAAGPALPLVQAKRSRANSSSKSYRVLSELVSLVQLSVTATALALYYLLYCYMQLVYYTLRSALYFHNADGPMKITIGVVTLTSILIGFNIILRMERIAGFLS